MSIVDVNETFMMVAQNTSDAAVQVVDNMSHDVAHGGAFYQGPEFWVGFSFILVVLLLMRPVGKVLGGMINKRIDNIANRISEVKQLNEDSKQLLEEYEAKYQNAQKEADAILQKSEREISQIKEERMKKLELEMEIKQKEAETRIKSAQDSALKEITELTSEMTIKALKIALANNLSSKTQDKLIEESIENIKKVAE